MHADDMDLVREFAANGSEAAFATLVGRHVNLVYSAALRRLGNPHEAEEVAQAVFIILAKKAGSLRRGTILSGWLYQTAQFTAANFQRAALRRQHREQEAYMQFSDQSEPDVSWHRLSPLLEEALARLGEGNATPSCCVSLKIAPFVKWPRRLACGKTPRKNGSTVPRASSATFSSGAASKFPPPPC